MGRIFLFFLLFFYFELSHANNWSYRTLKNGLQVFVKEDHRAPVAHIEIWYRVGSIDESEGKTGLSHMLEHMMFQGSQHYPASTYARLISERGGRHNAYTTPDYTAYYAFVKNTDLPLVFDLESDRLGNLQLDPDAFRNEQAVVIEERHLRIENDPRALLAEHFNQTAYSGTPYAHPTIGWLADIQNYTVEDVQAWYQQWYLPQNAIMIIIGDINTDNTLDLVEEKFGSIDKKIDLHHHIDAETTVKTPPPQSATFEIHEKIQVPLLMLGYPVPSFTTSEQDYIPYALMLLSTYLTDGDDALLSRILIKEKSMAAAVESSYDPFTRGRTQFVLELIPSKQISVQNLKKETVNILEKLKKDLISPEELRRLKIQFRANLIYQQDQLDAQARWLGKVLIAHQSPELAETFLDPIQAVTAEQIQSVIRLYCVDNHLTQGVLLPTSAAEERKKP